MSDYEADESEIQGVAGYAIEIPDFREWKISKYYDYSNLSADYEDLQELNKQIAAARMAIFRLTESINSAEKKAKKAKMAYERSYRRKYIESREKNIADKKISAEIQVEDLENKYMYFDQILIELNRAHYTVRQELRSLEAVGNNLRQQLKA